MIDMTPGTIIEVEDGGLMTRAEVINDYGDKVNCRILEHYFSDEVGQYATYSKSKILFTLKG